MVPTNLFEEHFSPDRAHGTAGCGQTALGSNRRLPAEVITELVQVHPGRG